MLLASCARRGQEGGPDERNRLAYAEYIYDLLFFFSFYTILGFFFSLWSNREALEYSRYVDNNRSRALTTVAVAWNVSPRRVVWPSPFIYHHRLYVCVFIQIHTLCIGQECYPFCRGARIAYKVLSLYGGCDTITDCISKEGRKKHTLECLMMVAKENWCI